MWLWLREDKSLGLARVGAVMLILYGIIPTLQPAHFGRVYVAYGGIFIVLALLWEWRIDKTKLDTFDLAGALMALIGVSVMMYWPR